MAGCGDATGPRGHGATGQPLLTGPPSPFIWNTPILWSQNVSFIGVNHGKSWQISLLVVSWWCLLWGRDYLATRDRDIAWGMWHQDSAAKYLAKHLTEGWQNCEPTLNEEIRSHHGRASSATRRSPAIACSWCSDNLRHWEEPGVSHWNTEDSLSWISQICPNITIYYYNIYIYIVSS